MKQSFPLSKVQYGIYAECVGHIGEICYNLPYLYLLDRSLDATRLLEAIRQAVMAHPTLFTRIELTDDGEPRQVIDLEKETWSLDVEDVDDVEQSAPLLVAPFEIYGGRLFRFHLLRDARRFGLLIDYHHLIVDGTSMSLLLHDISAAYGGQTLAPESVTMADIAAEEASLRQTPAFNEAKQWYARNFDCGDTYSPLLPDREDSELAEGHLLRTLQTDITRVEQFCRENGIYKSTFFTMAYAYLLAKYNNDQEALFDTVYNGRKSKQLSRTVGMFVKTLPVYAKFTAETTVIDYLRRGQEQMSGCREHDIYSYSDIMDDLKLQAATMFAWHGMLFSDNELCGCPMQAQRIGNSTLDAPLYLKAFLLNGKCQVKAEYRANEFSQTLVAQFLESYEAVVEGLLTHSLLLDISIASPTQVSALDAFNQTDVPYDDTQTIVSLFARQAKATPDNIAVVYGDRQYTYAQVDALSDRIAANLVARGLQSEDVVSVLIPRCEWMAIASLGVLKAGCAYQPLDPSYPKERLNFMMKDANARLLIADAELRPIVDEFDGEVLEIIWDSKGMEWILRDSKGQMISVSQMLQENETSPNIPKNPLISPSIPEKISSSNLFIMLYTSGSTGIPKGCQLTHGNLVAFCQWYQKFYDLKPENKVAAYASYGFDACMMDLYPALTCGASVHIIPEEIRLDLIALNEYFEQNDITHSFMTTQVGYQFATSIENHSLKYLSTGGEKLAAITPPTGYKFYNVYGPTECTIFTTFFQVEKKMKEIPIGKALDNVRLYVVDSQGHRLPVGAAGELWVAGPQVSRGYLNRPEKMAEVYIANPFTTEAKYARVYRTGDIVRYLPDGNIQFVGRRDGQVKIRGFRIELKEVESVIREFPGIKDATVQAFDEEGGGKFIAAYIVSPDTIDIEALNQFILDQKPPYMVPAVTMQIDAIPLNQNQKVNKRALPKPERKASNLSNPSNSSNLPMNVLEEELHEMLAGIVNNRDFNVATPLAYTGLTSISSIKLAVQVNKRYGVALDSRSLVKTGTLQSIENEILKAWMQGGPQPPQPSQTLRTPQTSQPLQPSSAPLSYAQTGVYFECLKNPASTIYNIPYLLTYPAGTDAAKLAECVKRVVGLHPELGVRFTTQGDAIVQVIDETIVTEVPIVKMKAEQLATYKNEFVKPFNLQKAPLYRFEVVQTGDVVHLLMDVHHLVFDGGSADLFIRQLNDALEGREVERETYSYLDFANDQQKAADSEVFHEAQQFFAERLQTCEGASEIPADLPKTDDQGHIGEEVCLPDYERLTAFCRSQGITPAHLFLGATAYVVSRYTNNRDVYLCTVSSGRSNLKIADTVGMFVNTLALGMSVDDVSVGEFLSAASEMFDQTLRHEDYPFARIATDYGFRPAIAYAYQVGVLSEYTVGGKPVGQELLELKVPKFKINIKIETRGVVVQYDDSLYSARLARGMAESIVAVASRMAEGPETKVRKLSIVSESQEQELATLRQTATDDAPFRFFHDCIPYFAAKQPDQDALVAIDASFTYREMEEVTRRIANALRQRGVKERDRVALLLPRTSRLILSLFGVLRAGAAYIPCDPEYPADRIRLILEDSEARYIITTADRLASVPADKAIDVEDLIGSVCFDAIETNITPDDLAYLIYTSGSTGRPKGVMLRHEGICNYLYGHPANVFANGVLTDARRILSVTTISFDAALQDIGMAFYNGKTLVLATEEQANNPLDLAALIEGQQVNMVSGTPSRWQTWLTSPDFCRAISHVDICRAGGEKFSDQLLAQMRSVTKARIFNCYGPTEITVASNNKELTHAELVTVGKPQLNVREFIVDQDGNELPVGVVGELYIGGRGVARGYNNLDQ
ncbi:MAG: amino acid adenylation domain-containing protein, partial [Bacteroidales bacterium]|nr:amino acid adenylation domain-containing protein [Bacteroidales bacterium]